ncbi:hypothetical protein [Micromonospora sp. NPDC047074]|uniref:hypothetical protein n=1 Tax=Micromonospora sp. NPDC047074 TaxID=3154339 RepID=UPI0033EE61D9
MGGLSVRLGDHPRRSPTKVADAEQAAVPVADLQLKYVGRYATIDAPQPRPGLQRGLRPPVGLSQVTAGRDGSPTAHEKGRHPGQVALGDDPPIQRGVEHAHRQVTVHPEDDIGQRSQWGGHGHPGDLAHGVGIDGELVHHDVRIGDPLWARPVRRQGHMDGGRRTEPGDPMQLGCGVENDDRTRPEDGDRSPDAGSTQCRRAQLGGRHEAAPRHPKPTA